MSHAVKRAHINAMGGDLLSNSRKPETVLVSAAQSFSLFLAYCTLD